MENSTSSPNTRADIAKIAGVSEFTVAKAETVLRSGSPAVQAAARTGKVGVARAAKISKLPPDQQQAALDAPRAKMGRPKGAGVLVSTTSKRPVEIPLDLLGELAAADKALMKDAGVPRYALSTIDLQHKAKALHAIVLRILAPTPYGEKP